jgi:hypothetical protein
MTMRNERGQTVIEFAVVFLMLSTMVFATIDLGRVFYVRLMLHGAAREASRFTLTGNVLPDPANPGQFLTRLDSIVYRLRRAAPTLDLKPAKVTIVGPGGAGDPGGPGDLVTIQVAYDIDFITPLGRTLYPGGRHHYTVSMVSRNEP